MTETETPACRSCWISRCSCWILAALSAADIDIRLTSHTCPNTNQQSASFSSQVRATKPHIQELISIFWLLTAWTQEPFHGSSEQSLSFCKSRFSKVASVYIGAISFAHKTQLLLSKLWTAPRRASACTNEERAAVQATQDWIGA